MNKAFRVRIQRHGLSSSEKFESEFAKFIDWVCRFSQKKFGDADWGMEITLSKISGHALIYYWCPEFELDPEYPIPFENFSAREQYRALRKHH
jgi:hypothetical protein